MESVLTSIKKLLGIAEDYEAFDIDIIMAINSAFMVLSQLGVGPVKPFIIKGKAETWSDFMETEDYEAVKSYVYLKTRLLFDPPQSSSVVDAMERTMREYEWRLNVIAEGSVGTQAPLSCKKDGENSK